MQVFLVVVKIRLTRPYAHWQACFDADRDARKAAGIEDVFRHPVMGEQAALYAVKTAHPRMVHDFVYDPDKRPEVEASGFLVGSEEILICETEA